MFTQVFLTFYSVNLCVNLQIDLLICNFVSVLTLDLITNNYSSSLVSLLCKSEINFATSLILLKTH